MNERIDIGLLKQHPHNPRIISATELGKLVKSLREFPEMLEVRPLIINQENEILGGNMRHRAAEILLKEGNETFKTLPCKRANWSLAKQKEFIIKDNTSAGDWDFDKLSEPEWSDMDSLGDWFGSSEDFHGNAEKPADNILVAKDDDYTGDDNQSQKYVINIGDVVELGGHRLLCGNSKDEACFNAILAGAKVDMVFTDPPYGVSIGDKNRMLSSVQKAGLSLDDIHADKLSPDELKAELLPAFKNLRKYSQDHCAYYVTAPQSGELSMMMMMMMMTAAGLPVRHVLIWKKSSPTFSMGRLDYDYKHEPILFTWVKRHKKIMGGEQRSSVWEYDKPRSSKAHPTMKPIPLVANAILNSTEAGDVVFDAYSGSGTTLMACQQTGRVFRGIELMGKYVSNTIERFLEAYPTESVKINGVPT